MGQFPTVKAGKRITDILLGNIIPWTVTKPSDQSVTSSTTLGNDNDLLFTAVANGTYDFLCFVSYEGGTRGSSDLKFQWSIPSGSMKFGAIFNNTVPTLVLNHGSASGSMTAGSNGAGSNLALIMAGTFTIGVTGGTAVLQWAQGTGSGTATKVHAGSGLWIAESS